MEDATAPRADLAPRDWLEIGLQLLKDGGLRALKLRGLAQTLGASTGSFYHHFKDFDGYHAALAGYFVEAHIDPLIVALSASDLAPVERIRAFADHVRDHDMAQLALAMRAWGKSDVRAAAAIREHDEKVMAFLIAELVAHGFEAVEAEIRSYALLAIGLSQVHADEGIDRSVLREGLLTLLCER
ncbi:TetR family transcriptional regulator [Sphingomonas sp. PP-CE-3A-406]|uniref:TetR/AcrR family transcriptional regulator n=1 Tax=Sphingomonas sp. PP-CE-3A-406 TaxID=2135659 RepID=UPI000F164DB2|nr:TetR/AcrR family transcriptional regulator [Sphingomonas sp. PP-CE-3A-406]RMB55231.1 TetR family transcriptional regulator [Sphingomonas sp. PP-CE-3A-406]